MPWHWQPGAAAGIGGPQLTAGIGSRRTSVADDRRPGRPTLPALAAAVLLGLLASACQPAAPTGPPPPRQTTTSLDIEAASTALAERLIAEGFTVERDVGGLRLRSEDPGLMRCDVLTIHPRGSESEQTQLARPDRTTSTAAVRIEQAGSRTRVSWEPRFLGSYLNRLDNIRFDSPCRSTGQLEQLLATALPD